jgi:hypothetical protein
MENDYLQNRKHWLDVERRLSRLHRTLAAEMTLAGEDGAEEVVGALEGALWHLGAGIERVVARQHTLRNGDYI